MAQQSNDKLARSLLDPSGREVVWPVVFAGVKNVVRANNLNNDTLSCIKGWLKSNDSQFHVPLLGLTVLHTISLNCSTVVRNQMATPKLFQRLEKQLAKPQGPQVATAIVQLLVDWACLYKQEELGSRSQALLDQPRYRQIAAGCGPSPAVLAMQDELQLGVPPVAPIRGEDFIRWMYRGASLTDRTPSLAANSSGGVGSGFTGWPSVLSGGLPGGAPPTISTQAVPELCRRMQADAERMKAALVSCRAAARSQRQAELATAMDAAYGEAERCSQWRRRVQDYTQRCDDPSGLSAVLAATDVINQALQNWQHFTGQEVYDTLRIAVPPPPPELIRRALTGSGSRPQGGGSSGKGSELADLLGMGHASSSTMHTAAAVLPTPNPPSQQQPATGNGNPFGSAAHYGAVSGAPVGRPPAASAQLPPPTHNPFAQPSAPAVGAQAPSQPMRIPATRGAAADWDPFAPSPPAAPAQPAAVAPSTAFAAGNGWAAFTQDAAAGGMSVTEPQSPILTSPQPSGGAILSPSAASAVSIASAASTPSGSGAGPPPLHPTITSPRPPPVGSSSYLQPFHDLLTPITPAATPQQAATASGAAAVAGNGGATARPGSVSATAGAVGSATAAVASSSSASNGHSYAYATAGAAATTAAAAAARVYPQIPTAGTSLSASTTAAPVARGGGFRSSSGSGEGAVSAPALDWQPEFERLASELRSLWAASSPALSHSPSSLSLMGAAAAGHGGGGGTAAATAALLPAVLARVKGMCEALAAQHARQVASLAPPLRSSSISEAALARDPSNSALAKLRDAVSASAPAGGGGAAEGAGINGPGAGGWAAFGAGGRAQAIGPLQQHLLQQQQQQQQQHYSQQQQQQQPRANGVNPGSGREAASELSLI